MKSKCGIAIEGGKIVIPIRFRKSKKRHQDKAQKTLGDIERNGE